MITIIKPGNKQKKQYLKFRCFKCECEFLEEPKNITDTEEEEDHILGGYRVSYFLRCPNCYNRTRTRELLLLTDDEVESMECTE